MGRQFWIICSLCLGFPSTWTCQINDTNCNNTVGYSIVIPCEKTLSSGTLLNDSYVYWQDNDVKVLIHYEDGKLTETQNESYKNRVTISENNISSGNFTIKLENLTMEDDNKWVCAYYEDSELKKCVCKKNIFVAVSFSDPSIDLNRTAMLAYCTTQGGYPSPHLTWIHNYQNSLLERSEAGNTVITFKNETYHVESVVNVTGSLTVTCQVTNPTSKEVRNKTITISEETQDNTWIIVGTIGFIVVFIVGTIVGIIIRYKYAKSTCRQGDSASGHQTGQDDQPEAIPLRSLNNEVTSSGNN